jgi:hypothetical protein
MLIRTMCGFLHASPTHPPTHQGELAAGDQPRQSLYLGQLMQLRQERRQQGQQGRGTMQQAGGLADRLQASSRRAQGPGGGGMLEGDDSDEEGGRQQEGEDEGMEEGGAAGEEEADGHHMSAMEKAAARRRLVELLLPGETVLAALRRLGELLLLGWGLRKAGKGAGRASMLPLTAVGRLHRALWAYAATHTCPPLVYRRRSGSLLAVPCSSVVWTVYCAACVCCCCCCCCALSRPGTVLHCLATCRPQPRAVCMCDAPPYIAIPATQGA